jgi:6-phosphogluconolactonase
MEQVPQFALVWLGMGEDGHVASLFPNTDPQIDASQAITRITPDPLPPEAPFDRVSLTLPALLNSGRILFTLGGSEAKRRVFDEARAGANDLPIARLLAAAEQQVTCFA